MAKETAKDQAESFLKQSIEKITKNVDNISTFTKDNLEAVIQSANVAAKGAEDIVSECLSYSKQNVEGSVSAMKDLAGVRTLDQFVNIQTQLSRQVFESYVEQMTKLGDIFISTAKEASEPLNARLNAVTELLKNKAA